MQRGLLQFLGGRKKAALGSIELWLISAHDLLQAQWEATQMAAENEAAHGLCLNACILARAARKDGNRIFADGADVMKSMPAEKIGLWMKRYLELCAQENPSCCEGDHEEHKKALEQAPYERLKWQVLKKFGVLPSEERAKKMTDGDYLYCVLQMMLDEEEQLQSMCPACRELAQQARCVCCGEILDEENPNFDEARFEELRNGNVC